DHFLDRLQISYNVMAANSRCAVARLQNSAQHPDHCCLAGTVGPEEAKDRSFSNVKRNVINRRECAKAFGQSFALDHRLRHKEKWIQENREVDRLVPKPMVRAR